MRPNFIDYAKAIGIYMVVFGHYVYYLDLPFRNNLLWNFEHNVTLFHMPLFFLISGMLYKQSSFQITLKKSIQQLLKPYLLLCAVCFVIGFVFKAVQGEVLSIKEILKNCIGVVSGADFYGRGLISFSGALWFVYSLMCIKLFVAYVNKRFDKCRVDKCKNVCFLMVILLGGGMMYVGDILPFRIDSTCVGFIFFMIGHWGKNFFLKIQTLKKIQLVFLFLLSFVCLYWIAEWTINYDSRQGLSINALCFGRYPFLFLFSGIIGSLFIFSLSQLLSGIKNSFILKLSNGTIIVLGFHRLLYTFFKNHVTNPNLWFAILFSLFILLLCYFVIIMAEKYWPALLGNRKLE